METFTTVFIWIVFSLLMLIFGLGLTAYVREKVLHKKPFKNLYLTEKPMPFVGTPGKGIPLAITHEGSRLRVRWALSNYIFVIAGTGFFGPGMIMLWLFNAKFHDRLAHSPPPMPMEIMLVILVFVGTAIFFRELREFFFRRPVVEIGVDAIRLCIGPALTPSRTIWRQDIKGFSVQESAFHSNNYTCTDYALVADLQDRSLVMLCMTDRQDQILDIKSRATAMLNL